jgi:hypothetical protein
MTCSLSLLILFFTLCISQCSDAESGAVLGGVVLACVVSEMKGIRGSGAKNKSNWSTPRIKQLREQGRQRKHLLLFQPSWRSQGGLSLPYAACFPMTRGECGEERVHCQWHRRLR